MTSTYFLSHYAGVRKALLVVTMVAVVAGAAFGWWTLQGNPIEVFPACWPWPCCSHFGCGSNGSDSFARHRCCSF